MESVTKSAVLAKSIPPASAARKTGSILETDVSTSQPARAKNFNPSAASEAEKDVELPIANAFSSSFLYDSELLSAIPAVACNALILVVKSTPALVAAAPATPTGIVTPIVTLCPNCFVFCPALFTFSPIVSNGNCFKSLAKLLTSA